MTNEKKPLGAYADYRAKLKSASDIYVVEAKKLEDEYRIAMAKELEEAKKKQEDLKLKKK